MEVLASVPDLTAALEDGEPHLASAFLDKQRLWVHALRQEMGQVRSGNSYLERVVRRANICVVGKGETGRLIPSFGYCCK